MKRLESKRLILREREPADFKDFWDLSINWKAAPGPEFDKFPATEKECWNFFDDRLKNGSGTRYIYLRNEKRMIGLISFTRLDEHGRMNIEHIIHPDHQDDNTDRQALSNPLAIVFWGGVFSGKIGSIFTIFLPKLITKIINGIVGVVILLFGLKMVDRKNNNKVV